MRLFGGGASSLINGVDRAEDEHSGINEAKNSPRFPSLLGRNVRGNSSVPQNAAILVFDATRKETYQHLEEWHSQLISQRGQIPVIVVVNKIDLAPGTTKKQFQWPTSHGYPVFFTSAAKGQNVVRAFQEAIKLAWTHKNSPDDVMGVVCELLARQKDDASQ
jgi:GTPase SAR1 family protein